MKRIKLATPLAKCLDPPLSRATSIHAKKSFPRSNFYLYYRKEFFSIDQLKICHNTLETTGLMTSILCLNRSWIDVCVPHIRFCLEQIILFINPTCTCL